MGVILNGGRMKRFLEGRLDLAEALATDIPGAIYADVVLVVTAVLSACASIRWPGRRLDRKRFVELLVRHSPEDFRTSWVSIPALINQGLVLENDTPYMGGNSDRIFRDDEIDLSLHDARTRYPSVPEEQLRKHCYATLIYEWLRCGYAHEYCPHQNITHVPPSRANARVSYIGRLTDKNLTRMVSFHLPYLFDVANYHVSILPDTADSPPSAWWIDQK